MGRRQDDRPPDRDRGRARLLDLWATAGQIKARAERKAFADWSKARQEEDDRFEQEKKEREKRFEELLKSLPR